MGVIVAIANNKGGIGKTSVACNLGAALSLLKKKVLVIDNDPQANTSGILIDARNISTKKTLYELLDTDPKALATNVSECIYPCEHKNLYCLPNIEETAALEMDFAADFPSSNYYLRNKIREYVKNEFDIVLIDCQPTLGLFVSNALHSADFCIVPVDAGSSYSLDGLRRVLELIQTIQNAGNPDLKFLRLLINRVDLRISVSHAIIDDLAKRYGSDMVFKTHIPVNTTFQQAEYARRTIFQWSNTSRGAVSYRKLAREFISIINTI